MAYDDIEDIDFKEPSSMSFDIRGFFFKILKFWKLITLFVIVGLIIAYSINVRKQNVYSLNSLISIENDQNPFFTTNTSISFNWGGVSDKVGKIIIALSTRSHNEKVVDSLQFYVQYLKEGKYRKDDIYKNAPFKVEINKNSRQLLNKYIGIRFINENQYELVIDFENNLARTQRYSDKLMQTVSVTKGGFKKVFDIGEQVDLPFTSFKLLRKSNIEIIPESEYFIQFLNLLY